MPEFFIRGGDPAAAQGDIDKLLYSFEKLNRRSVKFRPYSIDLSELRDELCSASCLIMPSRTEGFGLVALEALAAGIPILVTSSSGFARHLLRLEMQERLDPGIVDVCILNVNDDAQSTVPVWADALRTILRDRRRSFETANTRRRVLRSHFDWEKASLAFLGEVQKLSGTKAL